MDKAYIAAPIFNSQQLAVVRSITVMLKMLEYDYFSPYENSRGIWKGRAPKDCLPQERAQVVDDNINFLHWAQLLVCWVGGTEDGRTDTGVIWEMGNFNALQRYNITSTGTNHPRFTLAYIHPDDKRQNMNLMLAATVDAVTMGPAQLHNALEMLKDPSGWAPAPAGLAHVREHFHPNKLLTHEKEPIS